MHDGIAFKATATRFGKASLVVHVSGRDLSTYGTTILVSILHEAGDLSTDNFRQSRFDGLEKITHETMSMFAQEDCGVGVVAYGCINGCGIRCSSIYLD